MARPRTKKSYDQLVEFLIWLSLRSSADDSQLAMGEFTMYSQHLKREWGTHYKRMLQRAEQELGLTLVRPHIYRPNGTGRSATYSLPKHIPDLKPILPEVLTDEHRIYLDTRSRTNLTTPPWIRDGQGDDGRYYTDFSHLNRKARSKVTLDGEAMVQFDISNAFPWMLSLIVPECESDVKEHLRLGTFYTYLQHIVNEHGAERIAQEFAARNFGGEPYVTRDEVKKAVSIAFNAPRVNFAEATQNHVGQWRCRHTPTSIRHWFVWWCLKQIAPKYTTSVRQLATSSKGATYYAGSRMEREIRQRIVQESQARDVAIMTVHDGFYVKESDADTFKPIFEGCCQDLTPKLHPIFQDATIQFTEPTIDLEEGIEPDDFEEMDGRIDQQEDILPAKRT